MNECGEGGFVRGDCEDRKGGRGDGEARWVKRGKVGEEMDGEERESEEGEGGGEGREVGE